MRIKLKQDRDTVLQVLRSDDIEKKLKLLERIEGVDDKESIKILMKMLEDKSWVMRERAARGLASFGTRVCSRLERLLKKGFWYTRASACLALGEIGDVQTVDSIIAVLLTDENPTVLKEASAALVNIARKKPDKFCDRLNAIGLGPDDLRSVMLALEKCDPAVHAEIKDLNKDGRGDL